MKKTFIFYTIPPSSDFTFYAQAVISATEADISRHIALISCSVA